MKHPELQFGVITWDDAVGDMVGQAHEVQHRPERCHTYGWILRSDVLGISIAGDWVVTNDTYRSITFIPRSMIVEEKLLSIVKLRTKKKGGTHDQDLTTVQPRAQREGP